MNLAESHFYETFQGPIPNLHWLLGTTHFYKTFQQGAIHCYHGYYMYIAFIQSNAIQQLGWPHVPSIGPRG